MMCFQVSRDCCQEKWKRDFAVYIPSFCDDPRVLQTKSPSNLLFMLQLWLLTFLFQPLSLLGGNGMCTCGIGNSALEACRWKPLVMIPSRLLCLYHLFSRAGTKIPFHPTGFSKVWESCLRYHLSLRAQPTQSAAEPNYAPCFNELCHTLSHPPRPISSFPAGLLSPAVRSSSSLFAVGALLGVVTPPSTRPGPCSAGLWGEMWDKPHSCETPALLLQHSQRQLGCAAHASFTDSSSRKEVLLFGLVLNPPNSTRGIRCQNFSQWSTFYPSPLPRISTQISPALWRCLQGCIAFTQRCLSETQQQSPPWGCSLQPIFWGNITRIVQ